MANRLLHLFILLIIYKSAVAQNKISNYELGYFFDINEKMINGYYDIDYNSKPLFEESYKQNKVFQNGIYVDLNKKIISGLIRPDENYIGFEFKTNDSSKIIHFGTEDCLSFKVGSDSIAVISDFDVERLTGAYHSNNKEFAEVIDRFDSITFYYHVRLGINHSVETYLYKNDSLKEFISIPKGSHKFKILASQVFKDSKLVTDQIESGKLSWEDIPKMIQFLKYQKIFNSKEKLFFNEEWEETNNQSEEYYYAYIQSIKDSTFNLKYYFKNGIPIYEGNITSFVPLRKNGEFIWYYPNATIRKKASYENNTLISKQIYFPNGKVHWEYKVEDNEIHYTRISDVDGNDLLNPHGDGEEHFYDSLMLRQIHREYKKGVLITSYYTDSKSDTIFQYFKKNVVMKNDFKLRRTLSSDFEYPKNSRRNNRHGLVLVRCIVEPSGLVSTIEIIKGIDNECNKLSADLFSLTQKEEYFRPAKVDKKSVRSEVIVPINFFEIGSTHLYYRYWNNYYWFNPFPAGVMSNPFPPPILMK